MSWNWLSGWAAVALVGLAAIGASDAAEEPRTEPPKAEAPAMTNTEVRTSQNAGGTAVTDTAAAKIELPKAAANALKKAYKQAVVGAIRVVEVHGVNLFDVDLMRANITGHVLVSAEGTIIFLETVIPFRQVPEDAVKAIETAAEGALISRAAMLDTFYEAKDGSLVKVAEGLRREFEARFVKGDREGTISVDARGNIVKPLTWKAAEKKEDRATAESPRPAPAEPPAKEMK
jgi:hypothetical protein